MLGDLILKFIKGWKQFWCIHDYQFEQEIPIYPDFWSIYRCSKCGRIKSMRW